MRDTDQTGSKFEKYDETMRFELHRISQTASLFGRYRASQVVGAKQEGLLSSRGNVRDFQYKIRVYSGVCNAGSIILLMVVCYIQ